MRMHHWGHRIQNQAAIPIIQPNATRSSVTSFLQREKMKTKFAVWTRRIGRRRSVGDNQAQPYASYLCFQPNIHHQSTSFPQQRRKDVSSIPMSIETRTFFYPMYNIRSEKKRILGTVTHSLTLRTSVSNLIRVFTASSTRHRGKSVIFSTFLSCLDSES